MFPGNVYQSGANSTDYRIKEVTLNPIHMEIGVWCDMCVWRNWQAQ